MLTAHFIGGLILRRGLLLFLRRGLLQPFSTDCSWWELELSQPIFLFTLQETHSQTCHVDCRTFPFPFFSWLSPPRLLKLLLFYSAQIFGSPKWYWLQCREDVIGNKKDYEKPERAVESWSNCWLNDWGCHPRFPLDTNRSWYPFLFSSQCIHQLKFLFDCIVKHVRQSNQCSDVIKKGFVVLIKEEFVGVQGRIWEIVC